MLETYKPDDPLEDSHLNAIKNLIKDHSDACFFRDFFEPGHITCSAILLSADKRRVLLNYHRGLQKWLSFGGHADGEKDFLKTAIREVEEESGITSFSPVMNTVFDVDVHEIPYNQKKDEPVHKHFDVRFLFSVDKPEHENFQLSLESIDLKWCSYQDAFFLIQKNDTGMQRMLLKWKNLCEKL
jgi:8-oxo-dGTP pyrophosphatase MutT (NUDIX family)